MNARSEFLIPRERTRGRICKCGGSMKKVVCTTKECRVYECKDCGRRGHYSRKPENCTASYG